ncbi:MAG: serine hydrolase domain-containing protein [Bacteroidota bacterium]
MKIHFKNLLFITLLPMLGVACTSAPAEVPPNAIQEEAIVFSFEQQLRWDLEDDHIRGAMAAALVKEGEILWTKGFGWVSPDSEVAVNDSTLFRIGSITKTFTAFLMLQLHEEGVIELDQPVETYLPEVRDISGYAEAKPFTFLQLASHTAGLQREPDWEEAATGPISEWEAKLVQALPYTSFAAQPGERYLYSNIGYGILGMALARAAGEPFISLVQRKIFQPLGMHQSYFVVPEASQRHLAQGLEGGPFGELRRDIPAEEHAGRGYKVPNGGIYTTATDLAKFLAATQGYRDMLSPESLARMHAPVLPPDSAWWQEYGMGSRLLRDEVVSTAGHSGMVSGYTANFMFQTEGPYGVVILRNSNWGMTNLDLESFAVLRRLQQLSEDSSY